LYEGEVLKTSGSMGIAVYPEHGSDTEQLLKNADIALYQAKATGRGNHRFFADAMSVELRERIFLEQELARAVGTAQLYVEYQPLFDLTSGRLTGLEALLRWNHPKRGLVPPKVFIPIAEHCELIEDRETCCESFAKICAIGNATASWCCQSRSTSRRFSWSGARSWNPCL
jgi:predicted signal transduction protein with EAL and GGDEF domain